MIKRALKLRYRLTEFCNDFKDKVPLDWLTEEDWEELAIIYNILSQFYYTTKRLEGIPERGHHGSMWEALPCIEMTLNHLEAAKKQYPISSPHKLIA